MNLTPSIQLLASRIAAAATAPCKVVLFGSHARGDAKSNSDTDLLVLQKHIPNKGDEYVRMMNVTAPSNVDLILMQEDDYQRRKNWVGSLPYRIEKEGVVLCG